MATTGKTIYQLTPEAERLAEERGYTASTQQKLPKELFDVLLKEGDLPTLLAEGGRDLTRQQLQQVRELAGKQSKRKLQAMSESLAGSPGYNEFMSLPIIAKILAGGKGKPTKPKTAQKQPTKTKKSPKNKDPEISTVAPNTIVPLKKDDTEADILAKMLNLHKFQREQDLKMYRSYDAKKKEIQDEREREFQELMDAFKPKEQKQKQAATQPKGKKFGFMKFAVLGGLGLLSTQKAFAGEVDNTTKSFSTSIKDVIDSIRKALDISPSAPSVSVDLSGDEGAAKKAAEKYLGNAISAEEWDKLLRATAAEASMNQAEEAGVMATILNRARMEGGGEGSITKVLTAKNQFQAVTGTVKNKHQPSEKYVKGPGEKEKASIFSGVEQYLQNVPKDQTKFTAADPKAYKEGTNIGYLHQLQREGGMVVGGTMFGKNIFGGAVPVAQNKPEIPVSTKVKKPAKKSIIIVQNNNMNSYLGDTNILVSRQEESDKSVVIDQQYYRR